MMPDQPNREHTYILVIVLLIWILFFQGIGNVALWDPDEPRQAIIAREMIERSDYIHTYLNGEPNLWKPPFYSWMIVLASKMLGEVNEFTARIPSAIAAGLLVLLTFFLGRRLADSWTGFLSAMVLLTNYQFLSNARESVMDMTFACLIGLSVFTSCVSLKKESRALFVFSFIPVSLAILTKGPAGLLISGGIIFLYLVVTKNFRRFIVPFIIGSLLSAALATIWFILAGQEYFDEIVVKQSFIRYVNAFDHQESVFYYFHKIFFNFLPWSILLPFSIYHGFRRKYWLPLLWFCFIFLFYELSTSKRAIYLLSLYPAAALLCGLWLRDMWTWFALQSKAKLVLKAFSAILIAIPAIAVIMFISFQNTALQPFRLSAAIYVYLTFMFMLGVAFMYALLRRFHTTSLHLLFAYLVLLGVAYTTHYLPVMDIVSKSPRLVTDILDDVAKDKDICLYGENSPGLIFYIGRPVKTIFTAQDLRRCVRPDSVVIIKEEDVPKVASDLTPLYRVNKTVSYEREAYTIYVAPKRTEFSSRS